MDSLDRNEEPWEQFLREWPIERLETMRLEEYTQAGSKDTFTYWIESRLDTYGSIWGGSAFKFGIFSRRATEEKENARGLRYGNEYAWYASLGENEKQAFFRVRQCLYRIAQVARAGHLQEIEQIKNLGEAYKWKVAYHYQRIDAPCMVGIFTKAPLRSFLDITDTSISMAALQQAAIRQQQPEEDTDIPPILPVKNAFNRIYYGPPGTGKTLAVQKLLQSDYTEKGTHRYRFVTFHQSFGYEEFIEGLRPVLNKESKQVCYEIRQGVFLQLCEQARHDPQHRYAMVIDEINRGNISRIMGELISLIETDKRSGMQNELTITLAYSGEPFTVPGNVDIIGTMNTADRSLAMLDTALRRRFEFTLRMADTSENGPLKDLQVVHRECIIDIRLMLQTLNERIEALYDHDHTLGHAYFMNLHNLPSIERFNALKNIFQSHILPLLEEYFFEDWQKIRLILGDHQKPLHQQFIRQSSAENELNRLFGANHDLGSDAMHPRFDLQPTAFDEPESYLAIYFNNIA